MNGDVNSFLLTLIAQFVQSAIGNHNVHRRIQLHAVGTECLLPRFIGPGGR